MIDKKNIEKELSVALNEKDFLISDFRTTSLSQNNTTFDIFGSNNKRYFLKVNNKNFTDMFSAEAYSLKILSKHKGFKIPKVITNFEDFNYQYLVLEYIEPCEKDADFFFNMGATLATMHKSDVQKFCGFEINNYIGKNHQINTKCENWVEFFGEYRLLEQVKILEKSENADIVFIRKIWQLIERLNKFLPSKPVFSLLHGDLWGGNYMCAKNSKPVLVDPACYYGDRETDIAMTELFGGFSPLFYKGYNSIYKLDKEYKERKDLYNLYHLLNHLNIFGKTYIAGCKVIVDKYV